ncbi:MAG TPA: hypothetical protein VFO55_11805 [Gemmatimonadaceae bacterium]|nr:hypothetical protein [Gemmatimonadaceae bacterium]
MFGVDVIGRSGMAEGIPILGWETPGPLTAGWLAVRLVKYSFTAVFFVVVMRFSLPDRQASDEQERPPGHAEKTGNT